MTKEKDNFRHFDAQVFIYDLEEVDWDKVYFNRDLYEKIDLLTLKILFLF